MGWLPSNDTCSTLSSQSALSTSSKGFVEQKMGGGGKLIGHRGGKLDQGLKGLRVVVRYQEIPESFRNGCMSFVTSK